MPGLRHLALLVRILIEDRQRLALENVALRHQLAVLKRSVKRAQIHDGDRMFWILMKRMLKEWREAVHFVKPDTIVRWHRKGFRYYLEAQVQVEAKSATDQLGTHPPDPAHVDGEHDVGRAEDLVRAGPARACRGGLDRSQVHGEGP